MRSKDICWVDHEPREPFPETDTDWDAVNALTDEQIHAAALADPDAPPLPFGSDEEMARLGFTHVVNTKKLREKLAMTQEQFASTYGIPVGTLRDWEQGRKNPDATARAYLKVIAKNPQTVAEWLRSAA